MHAARSATLALLLTVAIAGCSAFTDSPDANAPTDTATPIPVTTPTATATQTPHEVSTTYTKLDSNLRENEKPHTIRIVNGRNATVDAIIRITREDADYTIEETHTLDHSDNHYGLLDYKANYTVTIIVGDTSATGHIPASIFDCNDSTTQFDIAANGMWQEPKPRCNS